MCSTDPKDRKELSSANYLISFLMHGIVNDCLLASNTFSTITLVSDKVHLFTGWRDIPKEKPQAFHTLEKLNFEVKKWLSF